MLDKLKEDSIKFVNVLPGETIGKINLLSIGATNNSTKSNSFDDLIKYSTSIIKKCLWIPGIKAIYLCNNISFGINDNDSDIDLFIVTKRNYIFIARPLITIFLHCLGVRRHGEYVKNRFCLSFFIEEDEIELGELAFKNDIYLFFWMICLIPIYDPTNWKHSMLSRNLSFLNQFYEFNNIYKEKGLIIYDARLFIFKFSKFLESICALKIFNYIYNKSKKLQLNRCYNRYNKLKNKEGTIITDKILKFHNNDMRKRYSKLFYAK